VLVQAASPEKAQRSQLSQLAQPISFRSRRSSFICPGGVCVASAGASVLEVAGGVDSVVLGVVDAAGSEASCWHQEQLACRWRRCNRSELDESAGAGAGMALVPVRRISYGSSCPWSKTDTRLDTAAIPILRQQANRIRPRRCVPGDRSLFFFLV